ncbi:acyl-CoA thioesterase/bile acid-CoA:amino acid N-acyltransferase family protein [Streptomyces sp. BK239]|uniref:acyl-CoA thioesterase/bile acid-CoA:amino acid N-acyltransferase family protein n=1 Tax=Streptomyces sp. BK239 TaxID=2512155 RepID=UPI00102B7E8A|nr:acyl-CoA thioesterase/bile acid-CoA:amino acid N-acyltransferase family protein [Streptomyces sp. BK239]RZU14962.1 bile acid-CoA:amino acid N-acyltransferase [Streptomyces sp. BK239]
MQRARRRTAAYAAALALILPAGAGCSGGREPDVAHSQAATLHLDKPVGLADEPVHTRISGLASGEEVTVTARATDADGMTWTGRAVFTADDKGIVDLDHAEPEAGTYRGADGMGLFWSMTPAKGDPDKSWFRTEHPQKVSSYQVRLMVEAGSRTIAERQLTRTWAINGVHRKELTVAHDKLRGELFLPPSHGPRRAPVLLLGGSEGGLGDPLAAALLASRGHPALTLCYFDCQGRPKNLAAISLEYFAAAARLLRNQPQADAQRLVVIGASRGSEAAQLMAQYYPDLVRDAVVYMPSRNTNRAYYRGCFECGRGQAAWTKNGKGLQLIPIPLDHVRGTVLAIAGGDDPVWNSLPSAESIAQERNATGHKHRALLYPKAGHAVGVFPYLPDSGGSHLGGTRTANARAKADSWPHVLRLLGP